MGTDAEIQKDKIRRYGLLAIFAIVLIVLALILNPKPKMPPVAYSTDPSVVTEWHPPADYDRAMTDNGIAYGYKWLKRGEFSCDMGDRCWGIEVVSSQSCDSFYAQITLTDKNDVDVGWTNDTAQSLPADHPAKLVFVTYERAARSARLVQTSCH